MRLIPLLLLILMLFSCAPPPVGVQTPSLGTPARVAPAGDQKLRELWSKVDGVEIAEGEPLSVSYPTGVLFAASALLPMPGGAAQLDRLVETIKASGRDWRLLVRAQSGENGSYDQTLAAARVRILRTYLETAGLSRSQAQLQVDENAGAPLELRLLP